MDVTDLLKHHFGLPPEQQAIRDRCFHPSRAFVEFPKEDVETSIPARFEKIVSKLKDRTAVETAGQVVTYTELNAMANRAARAILEMTGKGGEPIALLFESSPSQMAAMLGVLKTGNFFVLLDPSLPRTRIDGVLENVGAKLILTDQKNFSLAHELTSQRGRVIECESLRNDPSAANLELPIPPKAIAFISYTAGSTGQPKGVIRDHREFLHHMMLYATAYRFQEHDRLSLLASATGRAIHDTFVALLNGGAIVPFDVRSEGVSHLIPWLYEKQISIWSVSAPLFRNVCKILTRKVELPELRLIRLGSETAYRDDFELYKKYFPRSCLLANGLTSNEAGLLSTFLMDVSIKLDGTELPIGYPVEDKEILLLDDAGRKVGFSEVGEIVVRSRYLSPGYWRRPELTEVKFKPDSSTGDERLYFTGDLGLMLSDGCLIHKGRKDFRLKIRGYGVDLVEVQNSLREHSAIKDTVVVGRQNETEETLIIAYFTSSNQQCPTTSELRKFLSKTLPDYMIPSAFVRLDVMPLTPNGKIDRRALPEPGKARPQLDVAYVVPQSEVETQLAQIWCEVLSLDQIGVNDNFFDLGGHSLLAVRLVSEVEKRFGKRVFVATLLKSPTIVELARVIRECNETTPSPLIAIQPSGSKPPFFCVHGTDSYVQLARYLGPDQPFYGLAQHLEGRKVRYTRIENIAEYYLREIQAVQPMGPYYIGGHSIGGLIAFELARQLQQKQQEVALLVLLDSGAPRNQRPVLNEPSMAGLSLRRLRDKFDTVRWTAKQKLLKDAKTTACEFYHRIGIPLPPSLQIFYVDQVVYGRIYAEAHRIYLPQSYSGRAVYLKSEDTRERVAGWEKLMTDGLEIRQVPGDHFSMLAEPHLQSLAQTLKDSLTKAQTGVRTGTQTGKVSSVAQCDETASHFRRAPTAIGV